MSVDVSLPRVHLTPLFFCVCFFGQYNEIWPTGGWGSIEYGTVGHTKGQVVGGRWKPLHYWYKASIFADVMATCGAGGECFVVNDAIVPFVGAVTIEFVHLANSTSTVVYHEAVKLAAGARTLKKFTVKLPLPPPTPAPPPTPPPGERDVSWHNESARQRVPCACARVRVCACAHVRVCVPAPPTTHLPDDAPDLVQGIASSLTTPTGVRKLPTRSGTR